MPHGSQSCTTGIPFILDVLGPRHRRKSKDPFCLHSTLVNPCCDSAAQDDLSRHVSVVAGELSVSTLNIEVMAPPKTRSQRKRPVRFLEDCEDAHPATKQTRAIEDALQLQSSTPTNALQHRSDASQLATLHHDTYPVLLQLDARMAPAVSLRLAKHKPNSAVIKFWKVYYQNFAVYNLQLIGDAQQQPGESVGIGTQDLMIHSAWAASLLPTTDTSRQASANRIDMLLPVKTPASVVSKMVESLHSGTLSLGHENVEQMLVLSHAMKVKLVEAACKKYLLDLDLSLEQLCQLVLLWDRLGDMSALTDTLRKLTWKPWLTPVAQAVARAFQHLLQGDGTRLEAARGVLQSPSCGKMCELQVFDMLLSAGISMSDPLLTTFLQVARINDAAFGFLEHAVQPSTISRPSYELLIQLPQLGAEASSETSADPTQYTLEMISPDKSLTGREAVTVVLISLSKSMPIVKPLCEWHMGNAGCMWTALSCAAKGIERFDRLES
ncbi:hypothetical protein WJX79_009431 [Trebouxia sp. C0005]